MRGFLIPLAAFPLAMIALSALGGAVSAQLSADAIINALKPPGTLASGSAHGMKLGGTATRSVSRPLASAPNPPAIAEASSQVVGPSVNLTVNFPTGSAELTPAARTCLDALGEALASDDLAGFRFRIEGHTDNVGSREENRVLSQRRAEAVVSYLTSQYNVAPARLEAVGMGHESPLVETPPQTPEARNRRVQVINLGA